jgi:site-specific recombinase XerD
MPVWSAKTSTADGYEGVIEQYLRPQFGNRALDKIKRDDIKAMINELIAKDLSRNTVRNALCVIRRIFNEAIEAGIVEVNPAAALVVSRESLRRQRSRASL